jgi:hypothetical protein
VGSQGAEKLGITSHFVATEPLEMPLGFRPGREFLKHLGQRLIDGTVQRFWVGANRVGGDAPPDELLRFESVTMRILRVPSGCGNCRM